MNASKLAAILSEQIDASVKAAATPEPPELVDMREVCRMLSISRPTGFRLVKRGTLRPVRLPGIRATRFRRNEVLELVR